ncbi:hypothetical protein [Moorena sp. SIO4G3]|uniref:hypothetical protein n=1 Tax=Moorena sp. SIO4G3 TaxID=2607821 RepID=UPI00142C9699|nr:hypothetical protein [Moorena sp. SIO4G3]NEO80530.1 hypothetical protein [Moorena sp. SIO4G3]
MGETTAVAHGGDPQDRAASPRPRCLPKTALAPQDRAASLFDTSLSGKYIDLPLSLPPHLYRLLK